MDKVRKIAFLDRDGVLNYEIGNYVTRLEDFKPLPHAVNNCKQLVAKGYYLVMVTNQGGISKELYTEADLHSFHHILINEFKKAGISFLERYYCPHHSIVENCLCRKPKGLMIEKAINKYKVNPDDCFLIGDNIRDIEAAKAAGLKKYFEIKPNTDWAFVLEQV